MTTNPEGSRDKNGRGKHPAARESWPRRLNRLLIAIGVIAFGLIIADRIISIYKTEETESAQLASGESNEAVQTTDEPVEEVGALVVGEATPIERDVELVTDIHSQFGSRLMFVSIADPKYLVTEDNRRFEVGTLIDDQTILASITEDQVIVERNGEFTALDLPDP
jgi:hypothetical protein